MTLELAQKHTLQASSFFRRVDRAAVVIQYPEVGRAVRSAPEPAKKWGRGRRSIPSPRARSQAARAMASSQSIEFSLTSSRIAVMRRVRISRLHAERRTIPPRRRFS
jgi:hypothetical protein